MYFKISKLECIQLFKNFLGFRALCICVKRELQDGGCGRPGLHSRRQVLLGRIHVPRVQGEDGRDAGTGQEYLQSLLLQGEPHYFVILKLKALCY